jgi:two-component system, OmpR family, sensor kinase
MAMSSAGGIGRAWQWLRALPDRTPLRVKMITAVLALVIIALGVMTFASRAVYRGYLMHRARSQLVQYENQVVPYANYVLNGGGGHFGRFAVFNNGLDRTWFLGPDGQQLQLTQGPQPNWTPPQVPTSTAWLTANEGNPATVATPSGDNWLVITHQISNVQVLTTPDPNGPFIVETVTLVVGTDLGNVNQAVGYLTEIDLLVSGAVIIILALVGIAVVRASLRPLTDIEETAAAIADGDLSQRVPDRDPRTEVGRLGRSLNAMLSQIETAFRARTESEEAARRSEWRMRQFVADASHELRTPLTAIRGYAEYYRQRGGVEEIQGAPARPALDRADPDAASTGAAVSRRHAYARPEREGPLSRAEVDRIMQRVEQESSRMGVLVEDMLLLARLDQQRPLERHTVDMLTLAGDAVHDARVVAPDRSIDLTVGAGAAFLVTGDEIRLRQVIGNLMSNALHHTPEGTPIAVRIRLASLDEWRAAAARAGRGVLAATDPDVPPSPAVVVEIADRGPGLTPEQAEHVFERFYRGDQARTRKSGGSGLGLAIVAALVAAHGGTVWAESPPGGGAIFRFAIPLAPEARYSAPGLDDGTDPDLLNSYYPSDDEPDVSPPDHEPDVLTDHGPDVYRPDHRPDVLPEGSRVGRHSAPPPGPPDLGPPPPDHWPE